jgi:hypothetical protein
MLSLLALVASATLAAMSFDEAKVLADRDEATIPAEQADEFKMSFIKIGRFAFSACMPTPPLEIVPNFTVVMRVGPSGKVLQTWLREATEFTECVESKFALATLPKPPTSPFYTSFEFIWGSDPN